MRPALLSLLLMACGGEIGHYECDAAPFIVTGEYPLNCDAMRANVALVKQILNARDIVPSDQFDETFQGVPVLVKNLIVLAKYDDGEGLVGLYGTYGIRLTYNSEALLHECLHHVDYRHLDLMSRWHDGWEARGWNAASDEYDSQRRSPSFDASGPLTEPQWP